jgi:hypothetical protein
MFLLSFMLAVCRQIVKKARERILTNNFKAICTWPSFFFRSLTSTRRLVLLNPDFLWQNVGFVSRAVNVAVFSKIQVCQNWRSGYSPFQLCLHPVLETTLCLTKLYLCIFINMRIMLFDPRNKTICSSRLYEPKIRF